MKDTVSFTIKGLAPSENHALLTTRNGRRYPSKEYLAWQELVSRQKEKTIKDTLWYGVEIVYYTKLFCKNGNVRRWDCTNYDKYTIDEVLKKVNNGTIDDRRILEYSGCKVDNDEDYTEITFYCIGE